jgi:uncharacterized protein
VQASADSLGTNFQSHFHARWNHLNDPDVRTLAWLLDAPDLLDPEAPQWQGRVATLGAVDQAVDDWLCMLDQAPAELRHFLGAQPFARLGRHAEKLMAFYLQWQGRLVAHGVQVRAEKSSTIGEFDFLLRDDTAGTALFHWEFATKLYLLEASGDGHQADYFVGPNLADTLGAKIRKIMDRQLLLSQHPAAQNILPAPVTAAQALVKGWLFYHGRTPLQPPGISRAHCRGFWCSLDEFDNLAAEHAILLPRLSWLAPAKTSEAQAQNKNDLRDLLHTHFDNNGMPVLLALLEARDGDMLEVDRGFVVPNDWRNRAAARARHQVSDLFPSRS